MHVYASAPVMHARSHTPGHAGVETTRIAAETHPWSRATYAGFRVVDEDFGIRLRGALPSAENGIIETVEAIMMAVRGVRGKWIGVGLAAAAAAALGMGLGQRATAQRMPLFESATRASSAIAPVREDLASAVRRERARGPIRASERDMDMEVEAPQPAPVDEVFLRGYPQQKLVPSRAPRVAARATLPPERQFDTLDYTYSFPPDDAIAVGPAHLVSAGNSAIRIATLSGAEVSTVTLGNFFSADTSGFLFDPRLSYDAATGHFILAVVGRKTDSPRAGVLAVAVSATSDPTGVWNKYLLNIGRGAPTANDWGDFPTLGYDGTAVYVAMNMFSFDTGSFTGTRIVTLDKSAMIAGQSLKPIFIDNAMLPSPPFVANQQAFGIRPVEALSPLVNGYLIANGGNAGLVVYRITNPLTSPQLAATFLDVSDLLQAASSPQPGGNGPLDAGDTRLQKSTYRDGILWTCASISATNGPGGPGAVMVYRIDVSGAAPRLVNSASISGSGLSFSFPAVVPDGSGNAVAVFQGSSATTLPGIYHARYDKDSGTFSAPLLTDQGSSPYVHLLDGVNRWGDYTDAAPDPNDPSMIWVQGAVANSTSAWQMHAARIPTSTSTGPQQPAGPTTVRAAALSATSIHLTWSETGAPDGIQVERKSASAGYALVQTLPGTATSWDDTGLQPGTTYTYRLRAAAAGVTSAYSAEASATTQPGLHSLTLKLSTVKAGKAVAGTVLLSGTAPTGGTRVALATSNPSVATVPASVLIKARKTSAAVKVKTRAKTSGTVTVTATLNGSSVQATLQVTP